MEYEDVAIHGSLGQATPVYALEQAPRFPEDLRRSRAVAPVEEAMIYVGSGKAAIALVLSYLKIKGALPNKMTPILVPAWLGTWVYAEMLNRGFPTTHADGPTPVVLCYHQYGFPQDMDKVLGIAEARKAVVIEDCAHAAGSLYKGTPLGSMGAFGLFSFSKFAFCFALGGVVAQDPEFRSFVAESLSKASSLLRLFVNGFKLLDEWNGGRAKLRAAPIFDGFRKMAYARYGEQLVAGPRALALWLAKRDKELAARRDNYSFLRARTDRFGLCDHLEPDGVAPYAVPLAVPTKAAGRLLAELRRRGVAAGLYQFDFARCVFEPDYRPCVLIPIHSGMRGRGMDIVFAAIDTSL